MKNLFIASLFCLFGAYASAQSLGINYQAIILDSQTQEVPGVNVNGNPLANTDVYIRFYIFNSDTIQEFSDHHATTTDEYGLINLLIGLVLILLYLWLLFWITCLFWIRLNKTIFSNANLHSCYCSSYLGY
jgi:hypothetical protein